MNDNITIIEIDYTKKQKFCMWVSGAWKWLNKNAGATALILSLISIIVAIVK